MRALCNDINPMSNMAHVGLLFEFLHRQVNINSGILIQIRPVWIISDGYEMARTGPIY